MSHILRKRIEDISDEVKELHPFLEELFQAIPEISSVRYTHGPNEKGADFLLTVRDTILTEDELIGVVVKRGKLSSDMTDVDRQVEECKERRFSHNGKKEVYLSAVWVVANGTISQRSQEKIWEKHKASKIKFIDINMLSDLAAKYTPYFGMEVPVKTAKYLRSQYIDALQRDERMSLLPTVQAELYLKQDIVEIESGRSLPTAKRKKIDILKEIPEKKALFLEAPMGGGKTKLLNLIVKHFCSEDAFQEHGFLPLYVHATDLFSIDGDDSKIILRQLLEKYGLNDGEQHSNALILVDGLDEVNVDSSVFSNRLDGVLYESNSLGCKIVFASRPVANEALEAIIEKFCSRYEIRPLTLVKVVEFISNICSGLSAQKRLMEDLKKSSVYRALPKTPISAIILATLIKEGASELPASMTELYSQYCELSLGRWDVDKGLGSLKEYEVASAVMERMAEFFLDNQIPCVSYNESLRFFESYLSERNIDVDPTFLLNKLLTRSDIIIKDIKFNTVCFKHRSFSEYYYAKRMYNSRHDKITEKVFHPYWSSSFFFFVGLKKDCPEILSEILDIPTSHEGLRLSKLVNIGTFLLAGYKSPYDVIKRGIEEAFREAGRYYADVVSRREDYILSQLPELHLLGLFRAVMRESYSFDFFARAVEEVNEEFATNPEIEDSIVYSLYLLDIVRADLGVPKAFDRLIDIYHKDLPLSLQLAISDIDSKGKNESSAAMKKIEKKMRKSLKSSDILRQSVRKLAFESINGKFDFSVFSAQKRMKKH